MGFSESKSRNRVPTNKAPVPHPYPQRTASPAVGKRKKYGSTQRAMRASYGRVRRSIRFMMIRWFLIERFSGLRLRVVNQNQPTSPVSPLSDERT